MKKIISLMLVMVLCLSACGSAGAGNNSQMQSEQTENTQNDNSSERMSEFESETDMTEIEDVTEIESETESETETESEIESESESESESEKESESEAPSEEDDNRQADEITWADIPLPSDFDPNGTVIVIDAGHQAKGNFNKEPLGPGSSTMKTKVAAGTTGCATGIPEYKLNLAVSLKLRDELKARGYQVVMVRETHNINISNAERAKLANNLNADAFIRIHANGSDNSSVHGVMTICQTPANPFNAEYYSVSRKLSDCVVNAFVEATGAKNRSVWETDTMTGINWCTVPTTIVEMGFMSNPEEDVLMSTEEYQNKMVQGIANGIDAYFGR